MVAQSDCGAKLFHFKISASRSKFGSDPSAVTQPELFTKATA